MLFVYVNGLINYLSSVLFFFCVGLSFFINLYYVSFLLVTQMRLTSVH